MSNKRLVKSQYLYKVQNLTSKKLKEGLIATKSRTRWSSFLKILIYWPFLFNCLQFLFIKCDFILLTLQVLTRRTVTTFLLKILDQLARHNFSTPDKSTPPPVSQLFSKIVVVSTQWCISLKKRIIIFEIILIYRKKSLHFRPSVFH